MYNDINISDSSTICAIATPHGRGGIAVIRISGPDAIAISDKIWRGKSLDAVQSHTAHLGNVLHTDGSILDQAVATVYRAPRSFTGENVVEIAVHGSVYIQQQLLQSLIAAGARLAGPGEFTQRAFSNGRLDLAQAEAVADIIAADSRAAHRIASQQMRGQFSRRIAQLRDSLLQLATLLELELDFSEEDVEFADRTRLIDITSQIEDETTRLYRSFQGGQAIKDGIPVAIIGAPNAGKSSILNALLGDDRAIVSDIPGTTRDTVEDTITLGDYTFRLIDTAGLRDTTDTVERIGIERARQSIDKSRIVIVVSDITKPLDSEILHAATSHLSSESPGYTIHALNKTDLAPHPDTLGQAAEFQAKTAESAPGHITTVQASTLTHQGTEALIQALTAAADSDAGTATDGLIITNARHAQHLSHAAASAAQARVQLTDGTPSDLVAQTIRETIHHLSAITGDIPSQEILNNIFANFCIGK